MTGKSNNYLNIKIYRKGIKNMSLKIMRLHQRTISHSNNRERIVDNDL